MNYGIVMCRFLRNNHRSIVGYRKWDLEVVELPTELCNSSSHKSTALPLFIKPISVTIPTIGLIVPRTAALLPPPWSRPLLNYNCRLALNVTRQVKVLDVC